MKVVNLCCEYLEQRLNCVGLFRIPGSTIDVQNIFQTFENPITVNLDNEENPHNVAGAFKCWLRELSTPIFPYEMFDSIIEAIKNYKETDDYIFIKTIVKSLPPSNLQVLERIIRFLKILTLKSNVNKMDEQNIGIVFGPTLIRQRPEIESANSFLEYQQKLSTCIVCLLTFYTEVFLETPKKYTIK